ncbi:MAG: hypothetical protein LH624_00170, partial [Cryobacterium sp.]|nr:hypothetical protein [Cryobacterium sp.]
MDDIDISFCFYDDLDYASDADRDSRVLREWHRRLWSKELPSGDMAEWLIEPGGYLTYDAPHGPVRVSSDTIATTHSRYASFGIPEMWARLSHSEQLRYDRTFYSIGGFTVFPVHPQSLNQVRGTESRIADRFDLTLECIRRHFVGGQESPLAPVLEVDADFFRLFGEGQSGFAAYVDFFHLQDLVSGNHIKWLDGSTADEWDFGTTALPQSESAYRHYL